MKICYCHSSCCLPCHLCLGMETNRSKAIFGFTLVQRSLSQARSVENEMLLFTTIESTQVGQNYGDIISYLGFP